MDKNAIKKYAIWAREELIKRVSARAEKYGISKDNMVEGTADTVNGILLTFDEKKQRSKLIAQIKDKGYEQIMEEVAYTWFNRFCALRFMEINNYLPTHIRVFTDENNSFEPQIMAEAIHLELDGLDKNKVLNLKEKNSNDELYKYLLITQCNALSSILPGMFQKISDYTELLFPDNTLREGSVIEQMITLIEEENWQDAVQIIGWLYQYYNSVPKDIVFANLKKKIKIKKEDIPAATQLFTPDWIVRYMVENSLGRLWYEGHPDDELKSNWKYFLDEAEQEADVQAQLYKIREEYKLLKPEDIKCIDPCMGSGHILVYMFDVLMQIYESYGYNSRDAAASIVKKNLYGLDIDDRAAQLAYFAIMMKARQYDRRFFAREIQPHIYAIPDYEDWKEYGSLTIIDEMPQRPKNDNAQMSFNDLNNDFLNIVVDVAEVLTQKYDVVVTNPPYMGSSGMGAKLGEFVKKNYPDSKLDLFAVFIEKGNSMVVKNGYNSMVTMQSWMFLTSFEKMRNNIVSKKAISNLMHMENMVMGIAFGTAVVNFRNSRLNRYKGTYNHITMKDISEEDVPTEFPVKTNRFSQVSTENFSKIPGSPIAYWVSENFINMFLSKLLYDYTISDGQNVTSDNGRFVRFHWEVENRRINNGLKWRLYAKGGGFRKWYGNLIDVVDWSENAINFYHKESSARVIPKYLWYMQGITWGLITSNLPSFRMLPKEATFDKGGSSVFLKDITYFTYFTALLNSKVFLQVSLVLNATLNFQVKDIRSMPVIVAERNRVDKITEQNITLSKADWDSFETSWDFAKHPLLKYGVSITSGLGDVQNGEYPLAINIGVDTANGDFKLYEKNAPINYMLHSAFEIWKELCEKQFNQLKQNEEELNRIFIDIYGLQDELTPEVADKDVTVRKADITRDIKSFISYAVGCMLGRYSLDVEGLAYAGGELDNSKYTTYPADKDNILPICDDEYFADDIVGRFVSFVKTVYGKETVDENLKFIADALGGKGQPKEVLRNYFLNDFFADHCKIYQKRPIYWLFDSGKKNGFKALIYMHRYQPDTIARMRTDYVHEQQGRYRTALNDLEQRMNDATTAERVKLNKQLAKIKDQDSELRIYEEKIHHLADQMIPIDLDDGVKHNYELFQDVLAKIK